MEVITVHLAERTYSIRISEGLRGIADFIRERHHPTLAFLVGDTNTKAHLDRVAEALSSAGFRTHGVTIPPGEDQKCLASASHLYDSLVDAGADRRTLVVAVGGGVVGDLAGFVAATFNRGLPLLMVPTTLLAMVDSSVGGKVGINHARGKNLI
ncbi:MAG: iron-containing alcohol dehydrogenase, partial [Gemmataceae bacterium]